MAFIIGLILARLPIMVFIILLGYLAAIPVAHKLENWADGVRS